METRTLNLIYALITGCSIKGQLKPDIWDYEPGVRYFVSIFVEHFDYERLIETVDHHNCGVHPFGQRMYREGS